MKRSQTVWLSVPSLLFILAGLRDWLWPGLFTIDGGRHPHPIGDISAGILLLGLAGMQILRTRSRNAQADRGSRCTTPSAI